MFSKSKPVMAWCVARRRARALRIVLRCVTLCAVAFSVAPALASIVFGAISADSPGEAKKQWDPLFADLSKKTGIEITGFYANNYESIAKAVNEGRVQMAFMSGLGGIEAVDSGAMDVFAQFARTDGSQGYRATLLVRKDSPINSLADIVARPGVLTLARGGSTSVSGFLFAEKAFIEAKISPPLHFKKIMTNNHNANALSVATFEADVATNNQPDFVKFAQSFPDEAAKLKVVWQSTLIPHANLLWRRDLPAATKEKLRAAFLAYGTATGKEGKRQDSVLINIHNLEGFVPATNASLKPILETSKAIDFARVNDDTSASPSVRRERMSVIEQHYARIEAKLK
jgi:phosphonate transport system substrate-binding protein